MYYFYGMDQQAIMDNKGKIDKNLVLDYNASNSVSSTENSPAKSKKSVKSDQGCNEKSANKSGVKWNKLLKGIYV